MSARKCVLPLLSAMLLSLPAVAQDDQELVSQSPVLPPLPDIRLERISDSEVKIMGLPIGTEIRLPGVESILIVDKDSMLRSAPFSPPNIPDEKERQRREALFEKIKANRFDREHLYTVVYDFDREPLEWLLKCRKNFTELPDGTLNVERFLDGFSHEKLPGSSAILDLKKARMTVRNNGFMCSVLSGLLWPLLPQEYQE